MFECMLWLYCQSATSQGIDDPGSTGMLIHVPPANVNFAKTTQCRSVVLGVLRKWEWDVNTQSSIAIQRRKFFFLMATVHPMRRHNKTLKHLAPCALTKSLSSILREQYKIYVFLYGKTIKSKYILDIKPIFVKKN